MKYILIILVVLILSGCSYRQGFEPVKRNDMTTEALTFAIDF